VFQLYNVQSSLQNYLPSLFLIKTILRLKKINLIKIKDKSHNFIPEISKSTGEALGNMIWKSRNKVNEKKQQLENPISLENYQNRFPPFLLEFFDGLIVILKKKKNEIVNKKRK
jgi:hypothetical protein